MHIHFIYTFTDVHVTCRLLAQYASVNLFSNAEAIHETITDPIATTTIRVTKTNTYVAARRLTTCHVSVFGYPCDSVCFSLSRIGSEKEQDHQQQVRRHFADDLNLYKQHTAYTDTDQQHACYAYNCPGC